MQSVFQFILKVLSEVEVKDMCSLFEFFQQHQQALSCSNRFGLGPLVPGREGYNATTYKLLHSGKWYAFSFVATVWERNMYGCNGKVLTYFWPHGVSKCTTKWLV